MPSSTEINTLQHFFTARPVKRAYLFGSYSRNEQNIDSDIELLVEFDHAEPIGMKFFVYLIELEELLKRKVDLVSSEGLSKHVQPLIDKDKMLIYERVTP